MGTWGYEPKDSDNAGDLWYELVRKHVPTQIIKAVKPRRNDDLYSRYDKAGVVQQALEAGVWVPREAVQWAIEYIQDNIDSADEWKNPKAFVKHAKKILKAFQKLLDQTTSGIILAPAGWPGVKQPFMKRKKRKS